MQILISQYISDLKERRPEIGEFILCCERNSLNKEDFVAMWHCLRRLITTSKACGAMQLQKLAETLAEGLEKRENADRISLLSLSKVLLATCNEILTISEMPPNFTSHTFPDFAEKPTMLTVDDDRIIRETIDALFGKHVNLLKAKNGVEGLAMIREYKPDLILLDDMMPEMTGMKLLETMQQEDGTCLCPIIMLTSSDRPRDIERATNGGVVDYVIKPFDANELIRKVLKILDKFKTS